MKKPGFNIYKNVCNIYVYYILYTIYIYKYKALMKERALWKNITLNCFQLMKETWTL